MDLNCVARLFLRHRRRSTANANQKIDPSWSETKERPVSRADDTYRRSGRPSIPLLSWVKRSSALDPDDAKSFRESGRSSVLSLSSDPKRTSSPPGADLHRPSASGSTRRKRSIFSRGGHATRKSEELSARNTISNHDKAVHGCQDAGAPSWVRRCMSVKSSSGRSAPPSTPLPVYQESPYEEFNHRAPVPEFGFVPGFGYEPSRIQPDPSRGAAARAAAAAQNGILATMRNLSLVEPSLTRDSESGVGIEASIWLEAKREIPVPAIRKDPAHALPPEIMYHMLSFLDARALLHCGFVSRDWHHLSSSRYVWKKIYRDEFRNSLSRFSHSEAHASSDRDWKRMCKTQNALEQRWRAGHAAAIYLEGHTDSVYCVQFDKDKILTGSRDCTVRVWDTRTYECKRVLGIPSQVRTGMPPPLPVDSTELGRRPIAKLFSPHTIASSSSVKRSLAHDGSVLCLQYDNDMMVTGSSDGSLIVWDVPGDYTPIRRLRDHTSGVLDVCFDERYIVSCSKDATVKIWHRDTGQLFRTLRGHRGPVNAVQLRGDLVVSASGDGVAKLWDLTSGLCVKQFPSKDRGMACVEFSPDSKTILAGGNDQVIYQFDALTGDLVRELSGHEGLVRSLHLDNDSGRVVSGSYDTSVKAFDLKTGDTVVSLTKWTSSWILSAKADYRRIIATSQDSRAVIIDFGYQLPGVEELEI